MYKFVTNLYDGFYFTVPVVSSAVVIVDFDTCHFFEGGERVLLQNFRHQKTNNRALYMS